MSAYPGISALNNNLEDLGGIGPSGRPAADAPEPLSQRRSGREPSELSGKLSGKPSGKLSGTDKMTVGFLVFFLIMGMTVELYWVVLHGHIAPRAGKDFFATLFQVYGAADNAYFDADPAFPMGLESINVFFSQIVNAWLLYAILKRRYYRHVLQLIVSTYLAYSVTLYFLVAALSGFACMREKTAFNYFLFFAPNLPWLLCYLYMAYDSAAALLLRVRPARGAA